jgi:hypothetical protein
VKLVISVTDDVVVALAVLEAAGDWTVGCVDDPSANERFWCGLRTEDGLYRSATGPTSAEAVCRCARACSNLDDD